MLACLVRFEALVYFAGIIIYILLCEDPKKRKLLLFCLPAFALFCLLIISDVFLFENNMFFLHSYLLPRWQHFFSILSVNQFSANTTKNIFIVFKVLISKSIKVVSFPLLPLFVVGLCAVKSKMNKQNLFWYFTIIALLSLLTICIFYIKTGVMSPRYTVLAVLPSSIFMCFGIEKVLHFLELRGFQVKTAALLISLYIIITIIFSQSLYHQKADKVIYRSVGEYIASAEKNRNTIVMSSDPRAMFYANLHAGEVDCDNQSEHYAALIKMQYQEIVSFLKNNRVAYFVWEEKIWKDAG